MCFLLRVVTIIEERARFPVSSNSPSPIVGGLVPYLHPAQQPDLKLVEPIMKGQYSSRKPSIKFFALNMSILEKQRK